MNIGAIEASWRSLRDQWCKNAPPEIQARMRDAFYAGALGFMAHVHQQGISQNESRRRKKAVGEELALFGAQYDATLNDVAGSA